MQGITGGPPDAGAVRQVWSQSVLQIQEKSIRSRDNLLNPGEFFKPMSSLVDRGSSSDPKALHPIQGSPSDQGEVNQISDMKLCKKMRRKPHYIILKYITINIYDRCNTVQHNVILKGSFTYRSITILA